MRVTRGSEDSDKDGDESETETETAGWCPLSLSLPVSDPSEYRLCLLASLGGSEPADATMCADRPRNIPRTVEVPIERVRLAIPVHRQHHVTVSAQGE